MADYKIALSEAIVIPQKTVGEISKVSLMGRLMFVDGKLSLAEVNGSVMVGTAPETLNLSREDLIDIDLSSLQTALEEKVKAAIVAKYKP